MRGMGIAAEAWWEVAKNSPQNRTWLSWEIAKELCDRQSNSYAQTTFSENVQLEMKKTGTKMKHSGVDWSDIGTVRLMTLEFL
jgi:hypothetical protein